MPKKGAPKKPKEGAHEEGRGTPKKKGVDHKGPTGKKKRKNRPKKEPRLKKVKCGRKINGQKEVVLKPREVMHATKRAGKKPGHLGPKEGCRTINEGAASPSRRWRTEGTAEKKVLLRRFLSGTKRGGGPGGAEALKFRFRKTGTGLGQKLKGVGREKS